MRPHRGEREIALHQFSLTNNCRILVLTFKMVAIKFSGSGGIVYPIDPFAPLGHKTVGDATGYHTHIHAKVYLDKGVQTNSPVGGSIEHHVDAETSPITRSYAGSKEVDERYFHLLHKLVSYNCAQLPLQRVVGGQPIALVSPMSVGQER